MSPSDLFPSELQAGFSFLRSREDWVFAPQSAEDVDGFLQIIAGVHSWAVDCLKTGALIHQSDTKAWRVLAYLESDLFLSLLVLVASDRSLRALTSGQIQGDWDKIAAERLNVLNVFAAVSSIFSKENISAIRRALAP
jgi:hypothetical protein